MSDTDVPILARVYNSTVQRLQCDLRQFNSNAAFILACENIRKIYVWVGNNAQADDIALAETIGFDILREDYLNIGELETIKEDQESSQSLDVMLDQLFMKIDDYRQHTPFRAKKIENIPTTLSIIERKQNEYALKSVAYSTLNRSGMVPVLPFLSVVDRKTIAVLITGNVWDIWFAEAVSRREKMAVKAFIIEIAMANVPSQQRSLELVQFEHSLCLVGQDRPTALFRAQFSADTRYLATSNMKTRPSIARKSLNATKGSTQKCSDCVGDAILRLLGISSKQSPTSSSSTDADFSTTRSELDDDTKSTTSHGSSIFFSTEVLSSAFSGASTSTSSTISRNISNGDMNGSGKDSIYVKLQKLVGRTEIQFINPPRRNTKLLVLDLDHTLMDFSCRFDYMAEQLKRPYLDAFLAKTYLYYDIVVWSQTNFKWLELKLTELGMLNRKDYKICFALVRISKILSCLFPLMSFLTTLIVTFLIPCSVWSTSHQDKSTMLTVKQQYVKPLEIIWAKCSNLGWGPHNTIHVDDLERNFELNKQCGVLISPFHLKPVVNGAGPLDTDRTSYQDGSMPPPPPVTNGGSTRRPSFGGGSIGYTNGNAEGNTSNNIPIATNGGSTMLPKSGSSSSKLSNKGFEDIELQLLARYVFFNRL